MRANSQKEREGENKDKQGILMIQTELSRSCFIITLTRVSKKIDGKMENFTEELNYMKNEPHSPRVIYREKVTINTYFSGRIQKLMC